MITPNYLKKGDVLGVTALSSGTGLEIKDVKACLNNLKQEFRLIVTKDCFGDGIVSASDNERVLEFNSLLDEDIKMILILRGGNFLLETIDRINYQKVVDKKIWVGGYSDPSTLLYILTTKYDIKTIYGFNAKSYDDITLSYQKENLEILEGKRFHQESFTKNSLSLQGDFNSSGILIGGCLDAIRNLFGTEYDGTRIFLEKYHKQRIIWYLDIYAMNSVDTYLTLLQMKMMGYFNYSDVILIGKIMYPKEEEITYIEAYKKIFGNKNIVVDTDIGHIRPSFTMINGSMANICFKKNNLRIDIEVK